MIKDCAHPEAGSAANSSGGDSIVDALSRLPHFGGVADGILERLAAASRRSTFGEREFVFRAGEQARAFFVVTQGSVKLFRTTPDGKEQVLHRLGAGSTFAEAALLTMPIFPANCVATSTPTVIIEIGGETFLSLFDSDPHLSRAMVSSLSAWLQRLIQRVEELSVSSAAARLARYLLALPARESAEGLVVRLPVSQKELAAELGITPETLSRQLRKWKDRGYVHSSRGRVVLLEPDTLLLIADS